jgi:alpha-galactosidase
MNLSFNQKTGTVCWLVMTWIFFIIAQWSGCNQPQKSSITYNKGGEIIFENGSIQLTFDRLMYERVFNKNSGICFSTDQPIHSSKPSHYPVVNGQEIKDFSIDYDKISFTEINTNLGTGSRLILVGVAEGPDNSQIEKKLTVELYDSFPGVAISWVVYKNLGNAELLIDRVYSECYRLDASASNSELAPWQFWSLQGSSLQWGRDFIFQLTENFNQTNWMGVQPNTGTGGGIPVVDFWTKKSGFAVAYLEPKPQLVSMPVTVQEDKKVIVAIQQEVNQQLAPADSIQTIQTAVIVHSLDFYNALHTFSNLMHNQGVEMKKPSDEAYAAVWCGWGYEADFTASDILGTIPKLKELGIHWAVIDDRWFDRYGDWNVRKDEFPGGEKEFKAMVNELHRQNFLVQLWWIPTSVQSADPLGEWPSAAPGISQLAKDHPEWLIMGSDGKYLKDNRKMYMLCPSVPEVQDHIRQLTTRFVKDWDFDGHKLDAFFTVPPCYNPAHHHKSPAESHEMLPELFKIIYETTKKYKPNSVIQICNCGTAQDFYQEAYIDQPVTSDPVGALQVRQRIKVFKALMGSSTAAFADHVELSKMDRSEGDWREYGDDFASAVGTGGVVGTKFTWPGGPEAVRLTPEKETHWKKWIEIYNQKMLSKGIYLNLYDIGYDVPETHVVQKNDEMYYALYAIEWNGQVELRGLKNREYTVWDYPNNKSLGKVKGPQAMIDVSFNDNLLIECKPSTD